jgi:PAS domain-containing protein/uroporphyrinogen-III synthase
MEVARFRSQFFILLEQVSIQYRRAEQKLVNVGRGIGSTVRVARETVHARKYYWPELRRGGTAAIALANKGIEKIKPYISVLLKKAAVVGQRTQLSLKAGGYKARSLGQAIHARRYYWPELRRGGTAAIALANKGIEKIKPYISVLLKKAAVVGQRTQASLKAGGYKARSLGQAIHARRYYWPELRRGGTAAIALANKGIERIKPYISVLLKKAAVVGQRTQASLKAGGYKARSLGETVHARKYYWPELRKGGAVVIVVTSVGIAKSRAYLAELSEWTSVHLRQARQALASDKQKMEKVVAARKADLEAGYAAAMVATNRGLKKVGAQIHIPLKYGTRSIQRAGYKVANAGREIASKPRRIREARKTRENDLLNLIATSLDAIVVTDDEHRFVTANTNALQLFGVSYANIRNFTLDSFVANGQVAGFNGRGASKKKGNCKIRRLDGNVRLAEYEFTANYVPFRHLCIFRSATSKPVGSIARTDTVQF